MRKTVLLFGAFLLLALSTLSGQINISDARATMLGEEVIVEGVVTNGSELGIIRYIQDTTAGIAVYPGTGSVGDFPGDVNRGDSIRVRGTLKVFNELLEIDPVLEYAIISSGNTLPSPKLISSQDIDESVEGQLVSIESALFDDRGSVFGVGNYSFTTTSGSSEIYIRSNHPLVGMDIPLATVNIVGIVSQFNTIYQVLPRDENDIIIVDNFFINSTPIQNDITSNGFSMQWSTNAPGNAIVRYGLTQNLGSELIDNTTGTDHMVMIDGLDAGEFYYVQVVSDSGNSVVESPKGYYSTASTSTGTIHVYFNNTVDANFSAGFYPSATSPAEVENQIINYINNAISTIDISMYNSNRVPLIAALTNAHNRGVRVRFISDNETANLALSDPKPPFTIIRGNSDGLMHNKFLAIDADSVNDSWLLTGSMNFTEQNIANDFNNMLAIQDQALAKTYRLEFEEMWGSNGDAPGIFNVKFGSDKSDNTPHTFMVNGVRIESYFSPSDNTTANIAKRINEAENDLSFALLTFTNNTLGSSVFNAHQRGVNVRGIIDNISDTGSEYQFLTDRGVNVSEDFTTRSTHHKYCIFDSDPGANTPLVITGSHNWSAGAETRNDENTLIIFDEAVTNIFKQEFEARWCEAQGGSSCTTNLDDINETLSALLVYPNPSSDFINLEFALESKVDVTIALHSFEGKLLRATVLRNQSDFVRHNFDISNLNAGLYFVMLKADNRIYTHKLIVE